MTGQLTCVEICAGAGGQALGLEKAGFEPEALVEIEKDCRHTLTFNRPNWNVINDEQCDVKHFNGAPYKGIDLLAGGVPCPPFSIAGKQLGKNDERDLFPDALRIVDECRPRAVMLENVRGFLNAVFKDYRSNLKKQLRQMGYVADWRLLNASDYGVSQLRPRVVIVAIKDDISEHFVWPKPLNQTPPSIGELLFGQMASRGWQGSEKWMKQADDIAPTIVGGSKKHGGPDLGPTRAKRAWEALGVDGKGIANEVPDREFKGIPKLTVDMVAKIQGFPEDWHITGKKTSAYRQVGNAFPPPVAAAVATQIKKCLTQKRLFAVA